LRNSSSDCCYISWGWARKTWRVCLLSFASSAVHTQFDVLSSCRCFSFSFCTCTLPSFCCSLSIISLAVGTAASRNTWRVCFLSFALCAVCTWFDVLSSCRCYIFSFSTSRLVMLSRFFCYCPSIRHSVCAHNLMSFSRSARLDSLFSCALSAVAPLYIIRYVHIIWCATFSHSARLDSSYSYGLSAVASLYIIRAICAQFDVLSSYRCYISSFGKSTLFILLQFFCCCLSIYHSLCAHNLMCYISSFGTSRLFVLLRFFCCCVSFAVFAI